SIGVVPHRIGNGWPMDVPIDQRRRMMLAAANVQTSSVRQAAILGGLVRSAIDYGHLSMPVVSAHMSSVLSGLAGVDRREPCSAEVAMVLEQFQRSLGYRFAN